MRRVRISRPARYCTMVSILLLVLTWIVGGIQVFEAQGANGRYLGDVLTGFCPVEVGRIAGQNDDATGRICFHLIAVEMIDKVEAYPPGSVIVLPGNTSHFHWAKSGEYVTQVTAIGPLGLEYLNAADDPREHQQQN